MSHNQLGQHVEDQLTTRQVAEALNVSESSVKRWCDRGAIPTVRTLGGHRRIPLDGFLRFLEETNREAALSKPKEPDLCDSPAVDACCDVAALLPKFEKAVIEGNELKCLTVLTQYYSQNTSFAKLADDFVAATFHRLGELWDCGNLEIYQERRGCEVCHRVLHDFRRLLPAPPANAPIAIGAAPSGDQYTLPNQIIELVLQECSWQATNLGSNLPFETIASAVASYQPRLLWLSVSHLEDEEAFVRNYGEFQKQLPSQTIVVLGGRALHDKLRPRLKYTGHCDNMQQLSAFASAVRSNPLYIKSSDN
jgi:MerR family transcriptional regulator, light-induced transcriptional regulator